MKTDRKQWDAIFKDLSAEKFAEMLEAATGKPDIEMIGNSIFRLKKAYPVQDKDQLREYLLKHGRYGIADDDNFKMCYRGIENHINELIKECWVREVITYDGVRKTDNAKRRIFFPRDISEKKNPDD